MSFERYYGQKTMSSTPKASIWKSGQISLNKAFLSEYHISLPVKAMLFYDRDTRRIGIQFTGKKGEPGTLNLSKRAGGAMINAKGFFTYFGIPHDKAQRFNIKHDEDNDMFILEPEKTNKKGT